MRTILILTRRPTMPPTPARATRLLASPILALALADNTSGFPEGGWVPFLQIRYEITKEPSGANITGELMPMVASDGPHYGDNVKLAGRGKYHVRYTVLPPNARGNAAGQHFGRHIDRATGVGPWFEPFGVEWVFVYAGLGKKGGY